MSGFCGGFAMVMSFAVAVAMMACVAWLIGKGISKLGHFEDALARRIAQRKKRLKQIEAELRARRAAEANHGDGDCPCGAGVDRAGADTVITRVTCGDGEVYPTCVPVVRKNPDLPGPQG